MIVLLENVLSYQIEPGPLKVLDINVMHGANYFSAGKVVVMRLDLHEYDEVFTNDIPGFFDGLKKMIPSLHEHYCSEGKPGGFFLRVETGTLLGHVTEHVTIELQTLAGMDVAYGKTRSTNDPGVYNVVFRFLDEIVGVYAGKAAVNLVNSILKKKPFDIDKIVRDLVELREELVPGPSTQAIIEEAVKRNIPYLRLDEFNLMQIGTGKYRKRIRATVTSDSSLIGVETADDKYLSQVMLADAAIPVPVSEKVENPPDILEFQRREGDPVVIKPLKGSLGRGITVEPRSVEEISRAIQWAQEVSPEVLVQERVAGSVFRLLVIDYKFCAAARVEPPRIIGDGKHTIAQLLENLNNEENRGIGDKNLLTEVLTDDITRHILKTKQLHPDTILPEGEILQLKISSSLAQGGSAYDVTEIVHPRNKFIAERAAKVIGLDVAGIDIIAQGIEHSIVETGGKVIEINAAPDFRLHLKPTSGKPRPVAENFLDMLFPAETPARIPIISVTGTAGKTTTVHLLDYCLRLAGYKPGLTSTEGLYINGRRLMKGDMAYPEHVALVLKDPTIDSAILETSREGILRRGLGYEYADIGVVLNISADHVGFDDIKYLEDLAYAKSVVSEQVYEEGFSILNAGNELVMEMQDRVYGHLVLISHTYDNPVVRGHVEKGGTAVIMDGNYIIIYEKKSTRTELLHVEDIPLTFEGKATINYDNVLAAVAALHCFGMETEMIKKGLTTFEPSARTLPGRMNLIDLGDFRVLLDYAHNRAGYAGIKEYLETCETYKLGVIDAPGDRSDEDILELGKIAASTYDEIYVYEGYDQRGRKETEIVELLKQGAINEKFNPEKIKTFLEPEKAWEEGLKQGEEGKIVVILSGRSEKTIQMINKFSRSRVKKNKIKMKNEK
ncbi:MAG: cyanophycin synthetase [bacterium]|nr:cyanophycin synthetase [bacterium]